MACCPASRRVRVKIASVELGPGALFNPNNPPYYIFGGSKLGQSHPAGGCRGMMLRVSEIRVCVDEKTGLVYRSSSRWYPLVAVALCERT